jgi:hypothetical protein
MIAGECVCLLKFACIERSTTLHAVTLNNSRIFGFVLWSQGAVVLRPPGTRILGNVSRTHKVTTAGVADIRMYVRHRCIQIFHGFSEFSLSPSLVSEDHVLRTYCYLRENKLKAFNIQIPPFNAIQYS